MASASSDLVLSAAALSAAAAAAASSSATSAAGRADAPSASTEVDMGAGGAAGPLKPSFPALSAHEAAGGRDEKRAIRVPPHRYTPLKEAWEELVKPVVDHMKLLVRMNPRSRCVEIKTSAYTTETGALQKAEDYFKAFMLGFELKDAIALLRLDDLYIETFEITDVKMLKGDHLSRAIGRIAGVGGKTRYAIENATKTRIVVAEQKIHILGSFSNIQVARDAVCSLILGSPPGKVYNQMRQVAARVSSKM